MSEAADAVAPVVKPTAGRLLREAREKQGLHIAALAASIKVSPKKLEHLESDRFSELPDATFTRALAQTVCRALKTDPTPVMALLPPLIGHRLEHVGEGLNAPFRDRPGALVQRDWPQVIASPFFWIVGLLLVGAAVLYLLPARFSVLASNAPRPASTTSVHPGVEPGMPPDAVDAAPSMPASVGDMRAPSVPFVATVAATPLVAASAPTASTSVVVAELPASTAATTAAPSVSTPTSNALPAGLLQLRSTAASWIEVTDARGKPLVSRLLRAGESVGVDGAPPLKVRIGNASGTQLVFRGQPTELQPFTRDNVARLELK